MTIDRAHSPPSAAPTRAEACCAAFALVALAIALFAPPLIQVAAYHSFADQRAFAGVPNAADVLSNLAFLAIALAMVPRLVDRARPRFDRATEAGLATLAVALALTAIGSAVYHLDPRDATLVWDRVPMTLAFAAAVTIAVAQRVSVRAGAITLVLTATYGVASVLYWRASGNLTPYAVVQAGGALAIALLAIATPRRGDPFPWIWVLAWYALAKALEGADTAIYEMTQRYVAGHTLKHLAAAAAAAAIAWPVLRPRRRSRHESGRVSRRS